MEDQPGMDQLADEMKKIDFNHPYTPYDVQEQFMRTVYNVLEKGNGQIGILESPTGTGKSLSLICAAVTWLRNHKQAKFEASVEQVSEEFKAEPDWVIDQMLKRRRDEVIKRWEEREARLARVRAKERAQEIRGAKRRRLDEAAAHAAEQSEDEDEWLLEDREDQGGQADPHSGYSKETRALMEKVGMISKRDEAEEDDVGEQEIKIYYTSRTHSQLTQFISELRRPTFPPSIPTSLLPPESASEPEAVKQLPLSSRQRLCINPAVARLGSVQAINDRCAELQQPKSKGKCQFAPGPDNLGPTHQFRDSALATVPDIEDLFDLGKKLAVCPYYASRTAVPGAEVITLPYPLLLQKNARDALGIKLEGNVVIVDEAHNIMDAVANVYASEISLSELRRARQMLGVYVKKFGKKLKGENRVMVAQVARVVDGLSEWMDGAMKTKGEQGIVDSNALLKSKGVDQINLFKLIQYVQESKLAYKIEGYVAHTEQEGDPASTSRPSFSSPVLHTLVSFLVSLTNLSSEGRVFYHKTPGGGGKGQQQQPPDIKLSYLLLSPTHAFSSIASAARAVILAGGTMSPFADYTAHLFPDLPAARITTLSCGHVVPASSLCVWTLATPGRPGAPEFEFSFQRRGDRAVIHELGVALLNICAVVPDGVVVFFPSYGYLDEVVAAWSAASPPTNAAAVPTKKQESIWTRLQGKKAVFREAKGASSDEVLAQYSEAILGGPDGGSGGRGGGRGALLLSVVGGKMSEGINFSDRLGRCVVIVGLPYPNINSPDWKARLEYIETTTTRRLLTPGTSTTATEKEEKEKEEGGGVGGGEEERDKPAATMTRPEAVAKAKQAARDFYENACMRAVNQSIGRAIRHRGDYAAIVLVDRRFGTPRIRAKLPGWIQAGLVEGSEKGGLGPLMGRLGGFFKGKKGT